MTLPALRPNRMLEKMKKGESASVLFMGPFSTPEMVDAVCAAGIADVLWFDLEHLPHLAPQLAALGMIARAYPVSTIARIQPPTYATVMWPLEAGMNGIVVPMIETPEQAEAIVKWGKYDLGKGEGQRGWNRSFVAGAYGTIEARAYAEHQNAQTTLMVQIETPQGVEAAAEIASVRGIDGIFFGPGDYSHRIGQLGSFTSPQTREAMKRVAEAARKAGKWWGTPAMTPEIRKDVVAMGAQFILVGSDNVVVQRGLEATRKILES